MVLFDCSDDQNSDANIKLNNTLIESSSNKVKLPIEIFKEGIKPSPTEKREFENREKSLTKAFFGFFGLSGLRWRDQNE